MSDNKNIVPFDGTKYTIWKSRVRALVDELILDENALSIIDSETRPEKVSEQEWLKRNKMVKGIITRSLSDSFVGHATADPTLTARQIFKNLDELFSRKSVATELAMELKLSNFKYDNNTNLTKHIMVFDDLISDYETACGEKLKETYKIAKLLSSLPKIYAPLVVAIQTLSDDKLTLPFVKIRLLEHEVQLNNEINDTSCKTLMAGVNKEFHKKKIGDNKYYKNNRKFNQKFKNNLTIPYKNSNKYKYFKNKQNCDHCGRNNHVKRDCYYFKRMNSNNQQQQQIKQQQQQQQQHQIVNTAYIQSDEHFAFMMENNDKELSSIQLKTSEERKIQFVLDSGATDHIVNEVNVLTTSKDLIPPIKVNIAKKNETIIATKIGTIDVMTERGFSGTIKNVLYSEDLTYNLLSIKRMNQSGLDVIFCADGEVLFQKNGRVIINTSTQRNLSYVTFILKMKTCNLANTNSELNTYKLWHNRLGHIGRTKFLELKNQNFIANSQILKNVNPTDDICEACVYGKQSRLPFAKAKDKSHIVRPLYIIHSDVCGPISPKTLDDKSYFVTFIDDFTHYTVVYILTNKSEVFKVFQDYVSKSETHFNLKIANLYCDNGREYLANEFKNFCTQKGIQYHLTVPYTSQQNSVSERMNRSLVEKARAMIHGANLPKELWGEGILTATYLINMTPTKAIKLQKTPYELWHNKKPILDHLNIFGSIVYVHNKLQKEKFDKKSIKGILIGYQPNGYKVLVIETNKIIVARDVVFDEGNFYTSKFLIQNDEIGYESPSIKRQKLVENTEINSNDPFEINKPATKADEVNKVNEPCVQADKINMNSQSEQKEQELRRSARIQNMPSISYDENVNISAQSVICDTPSSYQEIKSRNDKLQWEEAINEEIRSLLKNETWETIPCPVNKNIVDCKWIFKIKNDNQGNLKYKARLVARGFSQEYLQDYDETFAPVARMTTLRTILAMANQFNFLVHQMDVKTAFLNGILEEDIYMRIPEGIKAKPNQVCKLKKALYGLKQAARCWFQRFDQILKEHKFQSSKVDRCLYFLDRNHITKKYLCYTLC